MRVSLAFLSSDAKTACIRRAGLLFDTENGNIVYAMCDRDSVRSVALTPDGLTLATGGMSNVAKVANVWGMHWDDG